MAPHLFMRVLKIPSRMTGEQGRGGQSEGERHHLGHEGRGIGPEIPRDGNGHSGGDAAGGQFLFIRKVFREGAF